MGGKELGWAGGLFLIAFMTVSCETQEPDCIQTPWDEVEPQCSKEMPLVWEEEVPEYWIRTGFCCKPGSDGEKAKRREVNACQVTKCVPPQLANPCSPEAELIRQRHLLGKPVKFEEIRRESCKLEDKSTGAAIYCCKKDSKETALLHLQGAEPHEFPHMAFLSSGGNCGATIYNKDYLITAAHCVVRNNEVNISENWKAKLGSNLASSSMPKNEYKIVEAIPHPDYSGLEGEAGVCKVKTAGLCNDIALVKVSPSIKFGPNIRPLPIAPNGFDEKKHASDTIILGWGKTDTLQGSEHLQKTNFIIRSDKTCFDESNNHAPYSGQHNISKELLCVGGITEGQYSPTAGSGDSGGPAICRDDTGQAVLCGVASFIGSVEEECEKYQDEGHCPPSVYVEVDQYSDWIKKVAGEQDKNENLKVQLYGEVVEANDYPHQVRITSPAKGKACGGTLIAPDVVVTTAQCAKTNAKTVKAQKLIKVWVGVDNISKGKSGGKAYTIETIKELPGHKLYGPSEKIMKSQTEIKGILYSDQLFKNDLALIKLKEKVSISPEELPRLPKKGEVFTGSAVELAFPRDKTRGGEIRKRNYKLLDQDECQNRMETLKKVIPDFKVKPGTLCGVEKYSGGSKCDRELGGGLICTGNDGKDVLCGVQKFRMCHSAIPNAFENLAQASDWLQGVLKTM